MTRREIIDAYRRMETEDKVQFRRWLATNAVIASAFVAALVAVVVVNSGGISSATIAHEAQANQLATK